MTSTSWVIGAGGLLGSAMLRVLRYESEEIFQSQTVAWGTPGASDQLSDGLAGLVSAAGSGRWQVYWCAGAGVTDSDPANLETEFLTFQSFLESVQKLPASIRSRGSIVLASSAGAVYGGSSGAPFTETSEAIPLGRYGVMKLLAEEALFALSANAKIPVFVGRIANLYGPGQSLTKRQGLVSMLCFSTVTRTPISIFVSLDTLRDYIYVDDCARLLSACGRRIQTLPADDSRHLKIIGSGRAVSVGTVVGQFRQVSGSRPLVVLGASHTAALQGRDLRLRSDYWTDLDSMSKTTFSAGIRSTIDDMRTSWLQPGRLARPLGAVQ